MRKQTKLVAVLSAAALLAMGASMTSFAAGWEKDDAGVWHYYDKDDEMVTGEWRKDGAKWFYLDEDGDMLMDAWVDDEYYVGADGAMLVNQWAKTIADEDVDDPEDDGDAWYYFGSKGKKVSGTDKKINGKTYIFDEDGKMQDGWYQDGDAVYYLGGEDEGWRASGWLWLEKPDDDDDIEICDDNCEACDEEGWYWFGTDGKMYKGVKQKKINGKYYYFNEHGQMLYEWINGVKSTKASNAQLDSSDITATPSEVRYMNVVEEGWRADGWYQIDGAEALGAGNDTDWYYFKDGEAKKAKYEEENGLTDDGDTIYRAKIKVEGKYFCFNELGQMQTGLQLIDGYMYYFDENGYMKTGKVSNVEEENDSFTYYFQTKNGGNGKGITGEKDGYLYWSGKRLEADDDYRIYVVNGDYFLVNNKGKLQKSSTKKYDVENGRGAEEVSFSFNKNSYKIQNLPDSWKKVAALPYIELMDNVIIHDGVDSGIITTWEEIEKSTETPDEDEDVEETDSDEKTE